MQNLAKRRAAEVETGREASNPTTCRILPAPLPPSICGPTAQVEELPWGTRALSKVPGMYLTSLSAGCLAPIMRGAPDPFFAHDRSKKAFTSCPDGVVLYGMHVPGM